MEISDTLTIIAIIVAPFAAVFAQRSVETWSDKKNRRILLFKNLMASRGTSLSIQHVQALNMIDLEFAGRKFDDVRSAWHSLHDHLGPLSEEVDDASTTLWLAKKAELSDQLLHTMARKLKYGFDPLDIKKGHYTPRYYDDIEEQSLATRRYLLEVLKGERSLTITSESSDPKKTELFQTNLLALLEGKKPLRVTIDADKDNRQ